MAIPVEFVGQKLGHYRIKQQIGAGGMGIVFLAHDERLERDVAVKVLPLGTFADESARKRFRKEALTLSKLNHPNIATIFDFDEENETSFLVTEYIAGPTVDAMLAAGPLPEKEVISLALQLADALAAAHDKGVVHCDLKPDNLRLTPDGRLKVLDFGIARLMHTAADENLATITLTQTTEIRGTLPYMAPEQLLGEPPDARTDIWSTGAVLYQLSSGSRPFQAKVATALAADIIHAPAPPPSGLRHGLSPLLESTILKCLEKKAEHRYQTARELKVDLNRVFTRQLTSPFPPPPAAEEQKEKTGSAPLSRNVPWKLVIAVLCLILLAAAGLYWNRHHPRSVAKSSLRQSVAVLGFKNLTGNAQDDWISNALATQLPTELAVGEKIRIISDEDVDRAKRDLSLESTDSLSRDTLTRIKRRLNSDLVVLGSYLNLDGQIRIDLRIQDANAGETIASLSESGKADEIEQLVTRTGIDLRQKLSLDQISREQVELMRASMPSSAKAAQFYAEGMTKLRNSDPLGARDLLQKAVEADPKYAMAHSALSAAWDQLGYDSEKQKEAKNAFDLSGNLLHEQRLLVEARYREATSEWDKAIDIYRALQTVVPDELEYGLRLASTQVRAGKTQDAYSTIQSLRAIPAPQRDDPRIDLAEAEAARNLSDFKLERKATERTIQKASQSGAQSLIAYAEWRRCFALLNLGDLDTARAAGEHALQIYKTQSDLLGQARSLTCIANVINSKGDTNAAQNLHEQALALTKSIGATRDSAGALMNLANVLSSRGDLDGAINRYQQALELCREIGDKSQLILVEHNLGAIYFSQGRYAVAAQNFELASQLAREIGDLAELAQARMNLSIIRLQQGRMDEAKAGIQEAIAATKQFGAQSDNATAIQILGDILLAQDDLAGAEKAYTESLVIQNKLGQNFGIASARRSLADLELQRKQSGKAETLARQAAEEFLAAKDGDNGTQARIVLIKALLAQGKVQEARAEIDRAEKLDVTDRTVKLDFTITSARVLVGEGRTSFAFSQLRDAISSARKAGLDNYELEATLALGEAQLQAGNVAQGRSILRNLEKDALRKNFKLIARKAHESASKN